MAFVRCIPFVRREDVREAERLGVANPYYTAQYDFTLVRRERPAVGRPERKRGAISAHERSCRS